MGTGYCVSPDTAGCPQSPNVAAVAAENPGGRLVAHRWISAHTARLGRIPARIGQEILPTLGSEDLMRRVIDEELARLAQAEQLSYMGRYLIF